MSTMTNQAETTTGTLDNWNQTDPQWLIDLPAKQLGTGLLLIKEPGSTVVEKIHRSDIEYGEFKLYAALQESFAIKWVPHNIADETTVLRIKCGGYCEATCVLPGCICDSNNHRCV